MVVSTEWKMDGDGFPVCSQVPALVEFDQGRPYVSVLNDKLISEPNPLARRFYLQGPLPPVVTTVQIVSHCQAIAG